MAGVAAGAIHASTHGRVRIWWCVLAIALGLVVLIAVAATFSGTIDCWSCREGDFTNGEVFVFLGVLLIPLSALTLVGMVLTAAAAEVVINDHWRLFGSA